MVDSRDDQIEALQREVIRLQAANRRLAEELDFAESATRVYRRLVERLMRDEKG